MRVKSVYDQLLPRPTFSRPLVWLMMICITVMIVWANLASVDTITRVPGTVVVSSKTKVIQSIDGGIVTNIFAAEGAAVQEGDILVTLGTEDIENAISEAQTKRVTLRVKDIRLRAEISGKKLVYPPDMVAYPRLIKEQLLLYRKRTDSYQEELASLESLIKLSDNELALMKPLELTGDIARSEILEIEKQLMKLASAKSSLQNDHEKKLQDELTSLQSELLEVDLQLEQLKTRLERSNLRAPVNGVVKNSGVSTVGGVIAPGQVIMEILPLDDALIIEASISPLDIASVGVGSEVFIKIDAYDYTEFGTVSGKVSYISADTILEENQGIKIPQYRLNVAIDLPENQPTYSAIKLIPGMTAQLDIKSGSRTIFSYLTRPLTKTLDEAFTEK